MENRQRLRWLCRRGMKELDVVLSNYLENQFDSASEYEQRAFCDLLEMQDPVIYSLLLGRETCDDSAIQELIQTIASAR